MRVVILMIGSKIGIGGVESLIPYLMRHLLERGIDVHLIAQFIPPYYKEDIFYGRIHEVFVPLQKSSFYLKIPRILRYILYLIYGFRIVKELLTLHPDVIHSQWYIPSVYAFIVNRLFKIPYIHTVHASIYHENYLPFRSMESWMQKLWRHSQVIKKATFVTAVSSPLSMETEKIIGRKVFTIPNGIDSKYFSLENRDKYRNKDNTLITVSRLTAVKSLKDAIASMQIIISSVPDCHLIIVGDGDQRLELESYVSRLKLSDSVTFVGAVRNSDVKKYYQQARIFLMPSEKEGMPMALLEALSCGLPFVATPVSIVPSLCNNQQEYNDGNTTDTNTQINSGIIVPFHSPEKIASAVIHLLSLSDSDLSLIAIKNHKIATEYSWDNVSNMYIELYNLA